MKQSLKLLKSLHYGVWVGLLTFWLVAIALPAVATNHHQKTPELEPTTLNTPFASGLQTQTNSAKTNRLATYDLLQAGKTAYEAGKFAEAAQYWQQATRDYQQNKNTAYQALATNYLALAYKELGQWLKAEEQVNRSLKLIENHIPRRRETANLTAIKAQILNTKGSIQLAMGNAELALQNWQQAEDYYRHDQDNIGLFGSRINQAQALQHLGLYRRAEKLLNHLQKDVTQQSDPYLKALGLRSLGNALQVTGNLEESKKVLEESLALTKEFKSAEATSSTLFSLGNVARISGQLDLAIDYYEQAATTAPHSLSAVESKLNQIDLLVEQEQWKKVINLVQQIKDDLDTTAVSRRTFYARVNLAKKLADLVSDNINFVGYENYIPQLLKTTISEAQSLKDPRSQSYALGTLGYWYEKHHNYSKAQQATTKALNLAVNSNASDISYQWQWQLGRLLQTQGDIQGAIAVETLAVETLQDIRSDLVATNADIQFSFRESVEPIYRNLVSLLLQKTPSQANLIQARETIESLQLAELENYFREACIDAKPKNIDQIDDQAAVIYPIILSDRLAVITSLPNSPIIYSENEIPEDKIDATLEKMLQSFNPIFSNKQRLQFSQQLYDWLIRPSEASFAKQNIETLVFVLDGSLRNLPMAALYDGEKYLIEKYRVALTPGLQLLESTSLDNSKLKAVVAGLSKSNQGFTALPGVETEVSEISQQIPTQTLLNSEFTDESLRDRIRVTSSPFVHLATHGQFSSNPEETFIVTWNNLIRVKEFENLLRAREETVDAKPIELLVMSACQTATGDKRAALGIAGVAVRSGARSTLATLWSVKDNSTVLLMNEFYQNLVNSDRSITKSEALRQAQITLIHSENFQHPFYWAPFILVGNWL